ncbi:MAG: permease prefix domain 1-containing protein [Gemmatimonadota bacterium]|nr:permease prefix domain 1-containing protein [Gemmatimonadota bacterium]MDQ8147089.1 permease prefix domain 1-containing protein [Gemmatimonadota bacterium]
MPHPAAQDPLEPQIDRWRQYLRRRQTVHSVDVAELEDHLRELIASLMTGGLAADEAFLVAVKRLGAIDALSREFAREHSDRLWKQLVTQGEAPTSPRLRREPFVAFGLAVAAGVLVKLPALFGLDLDADGAFYARNATLFILPLLTAYFGWKRDLPARALALPLVMFIGALLAANLPTFTPGGATEPLVALHLPIALWLAVGIAYAGARWREVAGRMDFLRFSGELFIYFVLIALGGGVLLATSAGIFESIGVDIEPFMEQWAPSLVLGAIIVAAWLVEAKQSVVENMAPVLTMLFTPLFTIALLLFLGTAAWTGRGVAIERDILLLFDLLLLLVVALLLYTLSARDPHRRVGAFDRAQLALILAALAVDMLALSAMTLRISGMGVTPNRVVALGLNAILLVNLAGAAALQVRFLSGRTPFARLERWQTDFLPVYGGWATFVAVGLPALFSYA